MGNRSGFGRSPSPTFEQRAAYVVGALLPLAELARRRADLADVTGYLDDFIIGLLLLVAAWIAGRQPLIGRPLLVLAWGAFCGGMYYAFFGQIVNPLPQDPSGIPSSSILVIKGALFILGIAAAIQATRATIRSSAVP